MMKLRSKQASEGSRPTYQMPLFDLFELNGKQHSVSTTEIPRLVTGVVEPT